MDDAVHWNRFHAQVRAWSMETLRRKAHVGRKNPNPHWAPLALLPSARRECTQHKTWTTSYQSARHKAWEITEHVLCNRQPIASFHAEVVLRRDGFSCRRPASFLWRSEIFQPLNCSRYNGVSRHRATLGAAVYVECWLNECCCCCWCSCSRSGSCSAAADGRNIWRTKFVWWVNTSNQ